MICLLNLNAPFLRNRRVETLGGIFDATFLANATDAELLALRDAYQMRDDDGQFREFSHVVAAYAENMQQALQASSPSSNGT